MVIKEIFFVDYCPKCKHKSKSESEDPCFDCLEIPGNDDSHKPVYFEEVDK